MSDLLQRARDITADQYIRLSMKNPSPNYTLTVWAEHVTGYARILREGGFDHDREVQTALAALRSVAA
jgi:hypothetical protein